MFAARRDGEEKSAILFLCMRIHARGVRVCRQWCAVVGRDYSRVEHISQEGILLSEHRHRLDEFGLRIAVVGEFDCLGVSVRRHGGYGDLER